MLGGIWLFENQIEVIYKWSMGYNCLILGWNEFWDKVSVEKLGFWVIFEIVGDRAVLNIPLGSFKCNKSF